MMKILLSLRQKQLYLGLVLGWLVLWLFPWGLLPSIHGHIFLVFLTDMVRLSVALIVFLIPGAIFYVLVNQEIEPDSYFPGIFPIGFTISACFIALFGLVGRIVGLSFDVVKYAFVLIGLVELILLAVRKPDFPLDSQKLKDAWRSLSRNAPLVLALILATLMTFNNHLFFIDDRTYLAYLTNWQYSEKLGFMNIVHSADVIELARFWLAMNPMWQALLADLSGLSGLVLLGNYLELFLVPLAVITAYWFARILGFSQRAAGFAVLIQVTLYSWMIGYHLPAGTWFYQSMSEDKVIAAFIFAPVFFVFGLDYLQQPGRRVLILFFLTTIVLTLTHPVILFFSASVLICMGIIALLVKKTNWRDFLYLVMIIVCAMIPYLVIRVVDHPSIPTLAISADILGESFEIERYARVVNDVFYGLNPNVLKFFDIEVENAALNAGLQTFRVMPVLIILLAGLIALLNFRKGLLYWYISSCVVLIVFAAVPYTGWLLGYFVSARQISRSAWFSPLGVGSVLILKSIIDWLNRSGKKFGPRFGWLSKTLSRTSPGFIACFIFISPMLVAFGFLRIPYYFKVLDYNKQMSQVGNFITQNTNSPVTAISLDYEDTELLPGVSPNVSLISFREETVDDKHGFYPFSPEESHERIRASSAIRSLEQVEETADRCLSINAYDIKYILARVEIVDIYLHIIDECDILAKAAFETGQLVLFVIETEK